MHELVPWLACLLALPLATTCVLLLLFVRAKCNRRVRATATLIITVSPANHSPRALAHATAALAARLSDAVLLVAEPPAPPPHRGLHFIPLATPAPAARRSVLALLLKLFRNARALSSALVAAAAAPYTVTHIIVNTPPALPALPVLHAHRPLFPHAALTLDWHNLAYTLMRAPPALVRVAAVAEALSARPARNHWAVSRAMAAFLQRRFAVSPAVVYDRPRAAFVRAARGLDEPARRALLARVRRAAVRIGPPLTTHDAPLVVTSTSWTPDEDFALLLHALVRLDASAAAAPLVVVITGKGPLRADFEQRFRHARLNNIAVWLAWLPVDDYPLLLASATLGLSLHASSSGLDLPMKAVDMLACGLPVLALNYPCIRELVIPGRTGVLFDGAAGLEKEMRRLLFDDTHQVARLRQGVKAAFADGMEWQSYWERCALPTLRRAEGAPAS